MALTKVTYAMIEGASNNVLDFGAKGDGTTDDTAAIQSALNAGGVVYFPPNKTYVSSALTINNDVTVFGYDAILLQKANSAVTNTAGSGLVKILDDYALTVHGLKFDGNASNQTATYATYNFIWNSIGSLKMYECWVGNTKGHCIRTGNIDDFNAADFAHDVVIQNCQVIQGTTSNESGDSIRIERTHGALIDNNYVYGGLSGIRTQLYCKNLTITNNECAASWADVGVTAALSENIEILNNNCYDHFNHGCEIDGVVNCLVDGNNFHDNGGAGIVSAEAGASQFANSAQFWGSVAEGYGTDYSNQTYTSPLIANINTTYSNNKIVNNVAATRFTGCKSDVFTGNYVHNDTTTTETNLIQIQGGTLQETGVSVVKNFLSPAPNDSSAIGIYQYTFGATVSDNYLASKLIPLMTVAAVGMKDLNEGNRYLTNPALRSVLLSDVNDSTSQTGWAVTHTTSGSTTYPFSGIYGGAAKYKAVSVTARVASGTQAATIALNLYNSSGVFVETLGGGTNAITLTSAYQTFTYYPSGGTSPGCQLKVEITIPSASVTVYFTEINVYMIA